MSVDKSGYCFPLSLYRMEKELVPGQSYFTKNVVKFFELGQRTAERIIADYKDLNFSELREGASEGYAKELNDLSEATDLDAKVRTSAGVFFAALFGEAMFETGKTIAEAQQIKSDEEAFEVFKRTDFKNMQDEMAGQPVWPETSEQFENIKKIVKFEESVSKRIRNNNYWNLGLKIGVIAGALLGLLGALMGGATLMALGIGIIACSIGTWFLMRGIAAKNKELRAQALEVNQLCVDLLAQKVKLLPSATEKGLLA